MDYKSYYKYLCSEHWSFTRAGVLKRDKNQCFRCKQAAREVHHINYKNLVDIEDTDLISVCQECHGDIHKAVNEGYIPNPHNDISSLSLTNSGLNDYFQTRTNLADKPGVILTIGFLHQLNCLAQHRKSQIWQALNQKQRSSVLDLTGEYISRKSFNKLRRIIQYSKSS